MASLIMNAANAASIKGIFFCNSARFPKIVLLSASSTPVSLAIHETPVTVIHFNASHTNPIIGERNLPTVLIAFTTLSANPSILGR